MLNKKYQPNECYKFSSNNIELESGERSYMNKNDYATHVTNVSNGLNKENILKPDFKKYMTRGDSLRNSGEYKKAVSCYLQSIMLERTNSDSYLGLGISYKYLNNYDKAIENFKKSINTNKDNNKLEAQSYYEMGVCYLLSNEMTKAITSFQKSIMKDRDNLDVQLQLALAHELVHEEDMALKIYDKLIEEHPNYTKAYSHKGALLICKGEYTEAISIFKQILKLEPKFHRAYFGLGVCFDNLKEYSYAKKYYQKFLKIHPNSSHAKYVESRIKLLNIRCKKENPLRLV